MLMAPKEIHNYVRLFTRFSCGLLLLLAGCSENQPVQEKKDEPGAEIIYHVFQRSFFDSNGDGQGDLQGMQQKLGYLQELGVKTVE